MNSRSPSIPPSLANFKFSIFSESYWSSIYVYAYYKASPSSFNTLLNLFNNVGPIFENPPQAIIMSSSSSHSIKSQITICSSIAKTRAEGGGSSDMKGPTSSGEIHVIVGPMFAGKTTALLRRVKSEAANGRKVALIKSSKDNRYAVDSVVTHDGIKYPCWALPNLQALTQRLESDAYSKLDVIGIDEAQFFDDLYDFCCKAADNDGKTIVIAGLDGDYLRRSFGSVLDIIPIADTVTKLTARCEQCGRKAFFTLRKTAQTQTELIAGADVYMPVCRQHYVNGQVIVEAAKVQSDHTFEPAAVNY